MIKLDLLDIKFVDKSVLIHFVESAKVDLAGWEDIYIALKKSNKYTFTAQQKRFII
jgi:hypothetical protein